MTWTITTTTTISASRAVTLAERIPSEPIKFVVLHPGTGAGGTVTIWDDLGRSVASTRIDSLSPRHEAEFFSDRSIFNVSAAIDGNATLSGAGVSVYLVSREAPEPSIADGSTSFAGPLLYPDGSLGRSGLARNSPCAISERLTQTMTGYTSYDGRKSFNIIKGRHGFRVEFRNFAQNNSTASEITNLATLGDVTYWFSVEYAGSFYRGYFNGNRKATLSPGGRILSDLIVIPDLPDLASVFVRSRAEVSGTSVPVLGVIGTYRDYEGVALGGTALVDSTGATGYTVSDDKAVPTATAIRADSDSLLFVGDSIIHGTGNDNLIDSTPGRQVVWGWARRWCYDKLPCDVFGYPGGTVEQFATIANAPFGHAAIDSYSANSAIIAFGANDCLTRTAEQIIAGYTSLISRFRAKGILKIIGVTIMPRTTSTDAWATTANQTPATGFGVGGVRDVVNAWIKSTPLLNGYIDPCPVVEAPGNVWKTGGKTTDGIHLRQAASILIVAALPSPLTYL